MLIVIGAVALAPSTQAQSTTAEPAGRAEVVAVIEKLFDGMRRQDTASMKSLFHSSASLFSSSQRNGVATVSVDPISSWLSSIAQAPDSVVLDERLMNTVVHLQDGLASVWTEYEFWVGSRFSHCGVDAFVLGRTSDGWKILSVADTRRRTGCSPTSQR